MLAEGRRAGSLRCRRGDTRILIRESATSACIGCRFTTSARRGCTGRCRKLRRVMAGVTTKPAKNAGAVFFSAAIRCLRFAATAPLPDGIDEFLLAGLPAQKIGRFSEVLDERPPGAGGVGFRDRRLHRSERTVANGRAVRRSHRLLYVAEDVSGVSRDRITHRNDAIYPATIVGMPPMEDFYIGTASVKLFLPILKMSFPEIVDMRCRPRGCSITSFSSASRKRIRSGVQNHARLVGHGTDDVHQIHRGGGRGCERA